MNIYLGDKVVREKTPTPKEWATQGPCPSGFHVPLADELTSLKTIWTSLGGGASDGNNFSTTLKLPLSGMRNNTNGNRTYNGSRGCYWSSSKKSATQSYYLLIRSNVITAPNNDSMSFGFSIRPFKNSPEIPTSSWTKLYGTSIESGGIFWSASDGLISLSANGQDWITIADKNLGASNVGDNGYFYQRGNNYGFDGMGSVLTEENSVNASTYGPGNYYSSSIFNTARPWDSSDNQNLRGGVDGNVPV